MLKLTKEITTKIAIGIRNLIFDTIFKSHIFTEILNFSNYFFSAPQGPIIAADDSGSTWTTTYTGGKNN